jgi:hypothetical protein
VLVLPLIGTLTYLVTQGRGMVEGRAADGVRQPADRSVRPTPPPAYTAVDEIARGKELLDRGVISQEEFEQLKRRVLV